MIILLYLWTDLLQITVNKYNDNITVIIFVRKLCLVELLLLLLLLIMKVSKFLILDIYRHRD